MISLLNILENEQYQGYRPRHHSQYQPESRFDSRGYVAPTGYARYGDYSSSRPTAPGYASKYAPPGYAAPRYDVRYEVPEEAYAPCYAPASPFGQRYVQPKQTVPELTTRQDADNFYVNIIDQDIANKNLNINFHKRSNNLIIVIEQFDDIYKSKLSFPEEVDYTNISAKYSSEGATIVVPKIKQEEYEQDEVEYYSPQDLLNALFNQQRQYQSKQRVEYKPKKRVEYKPRVHYQPEQVSYQPAKCVQQVKQQPSRPVKKVQTVAPPKQCPYITEKPQKSVKKADPVETPQVQYLDLSDFYSNLFGQFNQQQEKAAKPVTGKVAEKVEIPKSAPHPAAEFYQALFNQFNPEQANPEQANVSGNVPETPKSVPNPSADFYQALFNQFNPEQIKVAQQAVETPKPVAKTTTKPASKPVSKPSSKKIPIFVSNDHDSDASGEETPDEEYSEPSKKTVKPIKVTLEEVEDEQGYLSI